MTTTPSTTTATPRPAEFDARVMSYMPALKKRAYGLSRSKEEREDLVTDTIIKALADWQKFRPEGGFYNWLIFQMRHVAQTRMKMGQVRSRRMQFVSNDLAMAKASTPATQENYVELSEALRSLSKIRHGSTLLRRAMGDGLRELGEEEGCGREWIRQKEESARATLRKRAGLKVAA